MPLTADHGLLLEQVAIPLIAARILPYCLKVNASCLNAFTRAALLAPLLVRIGSSVSRILFGGHTVGNLIFNMAIAEAIKHFFAFAPKKPIRCPPGDTECKQRAKQQEASMDFLNASAAAYGMLSREPVSGGVFMQGSIGRFSYFIDAILFFIKLPFYTALGSWLSSKLPDVHPMAKGASAVFFSTLFRFYDIRLPLGLQNLASLVFFGLHWVMIRRAFENVSNSRIATALEPSSELVAKTD